MSSAAEGAAAELQPARSILLHVVSPSPEAQRLTFTDVPVSLTLLELKQKIQDAVPSRPAPDRQRLIYQGRALVRPDLTLESILGIETVAPVDAFTVHLVLPPEPVQHGQSSGATGAPRPNSLQPTTPLQFPGHEHPPGWTYGRFLEYMENAQRAGVSTEDAYRQWGPHRRTLQDEHTRDNAEMITDPSLRSPRAGSDPTGGQQPLGAGNATPGYSAHSLAPYHPPGSTLPPHIPPSSRRESPSVTAQNTARTTYPGLPRPPFEFLREFPRMSSRPTNGLTPENGDPNESQATQGQTPNLRGRTWVREGQTPGGEQWRMVVNETTTRVPGAANEDNHNTTIAVQRSQSVPGRNESALQGSSFTYVGRPSASPQGNNQGAAESQRPLPQAEYIHFRQSPVPPNMAGTNPLVAAFPGERGSIDRTTDRSHVSHRNNSSFPPVVYLIQSPEGHQAVLMPPEARQGTFPGTSGATGYYSLYPSYLHWPRSPQDLQMSLSETANYLRVMRREARGENGDLRRARRTTESPEFQRDNLANPDARDPIPPRNGVAEAAQRLNGGAAPQPHEHEEVDLLRIILPLGGHLWLLVRLLGFVYLFTGGAASWWRTSVLGLLAAFIFLHHIGVLDPIINALSGPVRRHLEGLLRVDPVPRPPPAAAAVAAANNGAFGANILRQGERTDQGQETRNTHGGGVTSAGAIPTPEQVAERLLREREQQDFSALRNGLRRAERAVALFVASLVPGVGEQHIRAREERERAQQREREMWEERRRREEEEVNRRAQAGAESERQQQQAVIAAEGD